MYSDSDGSDLPVISPDGRQVEITSAANNSLSSESSGDTQKSDNSLADESNHSGEKAVSHTENSETPESKDGNNFPIIIVSICSAIVIVAGVAFVIIKKVRK